MSQEDNALTAQFVGMHVKVESLASKGWADQGGARPRGFLPKRKDLWSKEFAPALDSCQPILLYVLLDLEEGRRVRSVETMVAHVKRNGHREDMWMPIQYPDDEAAKSHIREVLTGEARAALEARVAGASAVPVCLPSLVQLVGRPETCPEAGLLVDRYGLRKSPTIFGDGSSWTNQGSRLEFQTDAQGRIKSIFLSTLSIDRLAKDAPATSGQVEVRSVLGAPSCSAPDSSWDRFDDKVALHVQYSADKQSVTKLTVMDRLSAPGG